MKPTITYPTAFEQKIMSLEGANEGPSEIQLVIPSLTRPDTPFNIKVSVLDENGFPAIPSSELVINITCPLNSTNIDLPFPKGQPTTAIIEGLSLSAKGFHRFEAKLDNTLFHSNPTLCSKANNGQIYWGDPHIHTNLSNCHPERCRSLNYCFTAARYATCLDWASAADHVSNGRCEFAKWKEQVAVSNLFDDPGRFSTLPAYEASFHGGKGGDNNVYMSSFPDLFIDDYEEGDISTLVEKMKEKLSEDEFFVVPHHTTRPGKHGDLSSSIYPGKTMMPVVEIHSKWGTSEYRGNPNALLKIHEGPSYVSDLLNRGFPLGFVAGTDSHSTLTTARGKYEAEHIQAWHGMTAVFAESLDRESVFRAIKNRRCYAASRDRSLIMGSVNNHSFGSIVERSDESAAMIKATIAGKEDIAQIDIVRNGETIHSISPESWHHEIEYVDELMFNDIALPSPFIGKFVYYYVRVTFVNGAQAWSSPAWLVG